MTTKDKMKTMVTPKGRAVYAWLNKPDTKFARTENDGKYKVTLVLQKGDKENEEFVSNIIKLSEEHGCGTDPKYSSCAIKDGDGYRNMRGKLNTKPEFAGGWVMSFSTKYRPRLVDVNQDELPDDVPVYSGDTIRVAFRPTVWAGQSEPMLTLRPIGVMLVEKSSEGFDKTTMFGDIHEVGYERPDKEFVTEDGDF